MKEKLLKAEREKLSERMSVVPLRASEGMVLHCLLYHFSQYTTYKHTRILGNDGYFHLYAFLKQKKYDFNQNLIIKLVHI